MGLNVKYLYTFKLRCNLFCASESRFESIGFFDLWFELHFLSLPVTKNYEESAGMFCKLISSKLCGELILTGATMIYGIIFKLISL